MAAGPSERCRVTDYAQGMLHLLGDSPYLDP